MDNINLYYENIQKPWGKLFYKLLWDQLSFAKSMKILDFGSGFGLTSDYLAKWNNVIAIEPSETMCGMRYKENNYNQINGDLSNLNIYSEKSFDLILCHNVLEYVDEKDEYIKIFSNLLKSGGILSLVKHNRTGRIFQKAIHENDIKAAIKILNGEKSYAENFGEIKYYDNSQINIWINNYNYKIIEKYAIRTFFALNPDNSKKYDEEWFSDMFELEKKASILDEFRNAAFFNHILLEKL